MPDDQSNIPTEHVPTPPAPAAEGITPDIAAAMLGAARPAGGAWQPPSPEELQRSFPQYEIRGILGRGGMGAVYKGWQKSLDRFVAIKILPPGIDDSGMNFADRFRQEARAMAKFKHPGIVAVYDAGATPDGLLYFIMECIEGTDVQQLVASQGRLPPAQALGIIDRVCEALAYAHEHGVIHRDIKPSNVMIETDGTVKVADFGLAKLATQQSGMLTMSNVSMNTPDFMAPEALVDSAHVDHRADIYAVGVMLYQMLTGKVPRGRFVAPSRAVPGLDRRLDAIVDKALQTEPAARYSSAIELRTAIEPILAKLGGTRRSARVSSGSDAPRSAREATRSTLALAAVAVIIAGGFFALWKSGKWPAAKWPAQSSVRPGATDQSNTTAQGTVRTTSAALSPSTEPWVNALSDAGNLYLKDAEITPQGLSFRSSGSVSFERGPLRDGAVRMRVTFIPRIQPPKIHARVRDSSAPFYSLRIIDVDNAAILRWDNAKRSNDTLSKLPLPAPLKAGQDVELELRVVGTKLVAMFNGKVLGEAADSTVATGQFGVSNTVSAPALVKALEYLDLGSGAGSVSSSPSLPVSKSPQFPPGKWVKVFTKAEDIATNVLGKTAFVWREGWIDGTGSERPGILVVPGSKGRNQGMRLHGKFQPGGPVFGCTISVRRSRDPAGPRRYTSSSQTDGNAQIGYSVETEARQERLSMTRIGPTFASDAEFDLDLFVIGDKLYSRCNGKPLSVVTDTRLTEGELAVQTNHLIRDVEVINLDGLSEAGALKAAGVAK